MKRRTHIIGLAVLASVPAWAGEYVVLDNGFRLHADRHEQAGATVRIYDGVGVEEILASRVTGYEPEEAVTAPPAAPEPAKTVPAEHVETPAELAHLAAAKLALPQSFESLVTS